MIQLSSNQVNQFLEYGYIHLTDCFSKEFAEIWVKQAYTRLDCNPLDSSTWKQPFIRMKNESFVDLQTFSPKVFNAMCDLLGGEERIRCPIKWGDGFIVNFGLGANRMWEPPSANTKGWHKDGNFFYHFLDSPEQALLVIVIWKDVAHRGGGTFIATDSIEVMAKYLLANRQGIHRNEFDFHKLITQCKDFREITGKAGDVVLMHPYMLHASSQNHSSEIRLITNPLVSLKEPMRFNRGIIDDHSLVEQAVLRALNVNYLDFKIDSERRHYNLNK